MSYSRQEELFSEICVEIDELIGVNRKQVPMNFKGETRLCTEVSSKFDAYLKGDSVIFSFHDLSDYETVMGVFRQSSRMIGFDDHYLEFRLNLR